MKKIAALMGVALLGACTPSQEPQDTSRPTPPPAVNARIMLDPATLASGATAVDPVTYEYPFAIDSEPVNNYASAYAITPAKAQHSMMLAMAAPEALTKVIDQIQGHYMGHSLTDGEHMTLVIHTDDAVAPMQFDYVLSEFGRGLVLPVQVTPMPAPSTAQQKLGR